MNRNALSLLRLLSDGAFHSINTIAKQLKFSNVHTLQILNNQIPSEMNLVLTDDFLYCCWKNPILWLDKKLILSKLIDTEYKDIDIRLLDIVDSTNIYLNKFIKKKQ